MWAENDLHPGVPCLQSYTEPVNGKIYVMYHGTSRHAAQQIMAYGFQPSANGMLGRGVYLSRDLNKASRYPLDLPEHERVVIKVQVSVGRVKKIDYQGHPLQKSWHDHGYDTAWCPPNCGMVSSGLEEDCVWDPCRIQIIDIIYPRVQYGYPQVQCGCYHVQNMWGGNSSTLLQGNTNPVSGQVYTMYHGTSMEAAKKIRKEGFHQSVKGMFGRGVYLSRDLEKARRYPLNLQAYQRVVLKVKVNVGKVKKIDRQGHPLQKTWHDHGYDTAWCPPNCGMVASGLEEDCVWDPQRIQIIEMIYPFLEVVLPCANMWAEDDLGPGGPPCLQSYTAPEEDKVYVMYHGTFLLTALKILQEGFRPSSNGMLGRGVYLSRDLQKASRYPLHLPENHRVIVRVKVNVGRVKKIDCQGHPLQKTWHDHGYDTAWCPPNCGMVPSGLEEDCVWDPQRITVIDLIHPMLGEQHPCICAQCEKQNQRLSVANMWDEDDLGPGAPPCLESYIEPEDSEVYMMYHGTSRENAEKIEDYGFKQSSNGMLGRGVYLSRDLQKASRYPLDVPENERVIVRVKVNVGRVKKIDRKGHPLQKTWHDHGYDTAWCPPNCGKVPSGLEENCVWDPNRITVIDLIYPKKEEESFCRIL
ncbi:grass carp reovirus (GCRV)-induced gene 2e [Onychostoma macrolepis]|uniref:grass carp reovirus (GCRV)-induced gene 2e n=1 Tax=Onychostoma macrolepis TaxID=369639 RepID=UPI00272A2F69|nr:grass carp reovirus (GCRV)-induced gene 2e [Onychostoma macrolepis]